MIIMAPFYFILFFVQWHSSAPTEDHQLPPFHLQSFSKAVGKIVGELGYVQLYAVATVALLGICCWNL